MNIDLKAALIVVCTLLLGVILGGVGEGALMNARAGQVANLRRPTGFVAHIHDVIQPTSDSQWHTLEPIVDRTARANDSIMRGAQDGLHAAFDSLLAQVGPQLTAEQRRRLGDEIANPTAGPFGRMGGPGRGGRGRGGPPPDGSGGPPPL